jgi:hypothetical protein
MLVPATTLIHVSWNCQNLLFSASPMRPEASLSQIGFSARTGRPDTMLPAQADNPPIVPWPRSAARARPRPGAVSDSPVQRKLYSAPQSVRVALASSSTARTSRSASVVQHAPTFVVDTSSSLGYKSVAQRFASAAAFLLPPGPIAQSARSAHRNTTPTHRS